jgi:adenylyltransferase/sulfurtransferase
MDLLEETNSRYHRQELITWWDQSKLLSARVLVVGAGALGNEVAKNLALVGVGRVDIVDMDIIEHSNLARCVFFRTVDEGRFKSEVLTSAVSELNPDVVVGAFAVPVQRLGIGALAQYDLIIGALDNREARAWVNQAVRKLGGYWIDGAIEGLRGVVRMFGPEGACYACTLSEADWRQMSHRKSCALLAPEEILAGKTPTNATTASIVAGVQVQEAIKYLVGRLDLLSLVGKCWTYTGDLMESYVVGYREDELCGDHDRYHPLTESSSTTIAELISADGAAVDAIDFEEDLIALQACAQCGGTARIRARSSLSEGAGKCPTCEATLVGELFTSMSVTDPRTARTWEELGLATRDVVTLRHGESRRHYVINGEKS